ncbi:MAG: phage tail protein [Gammaproteobacteria bacterium]|nr:phage tail protein [Gammaproteobacteria bacterium]
MAIGERRDPYRQYNFLVEVDGLTRAGFKECYGLDSEQDIVEYREGNDKLAVRQLPGLVRFSNIVLKRGVTDDAELWNWRKNAQDGKVLRKNGSIILLDDTGVEKGRWNFTDAWPVKWVGPQFNATGNEVAIETLEITHEGVDKMSHSQSEKK